MADKICDNCMARVPQGSDTCPKCGIQFENTNPGGALPNGWVIGERYTIGRYMDIDGEGVTYAAIDGDTLQRVTVKEFMPVTLCASRNDDGSIQAKPGCEVLFKTTRMDFSELYGILLRMGLTEGLVQVLDVAEENNTAYAVLEKIEGPTLAEYLTRRDKPIDAARTLALLRPVLSGVEAMHNANIVHRGISPENIVLESGGTARLCGYGTLALRQQGSELKPKLYPGYSAPEQYAASEFEGRYTDIYALGAVLYRLVTGTEPSPADGRKVQDDLRPARAVNKEVPAFLSAGIARAMRVAQAERIQTVGELRLALSGEGPRSDKGAWGLTKQQMIIIGASAGAIVLLVLIILMVSALTRGRGGDSSSVSIPSSLSAPSSISVGETMLRLVGFKLDDIIENPAYTDVFTFETPTEEYSNDVEVGRIISQIPAEGETWDGKTPIKLVVSAGYEPVAMPDFVSNITTQTDAQNRLREMNIISTIIVEANDGKYEKGQVIRTEPAAGAQVQPPRTDDPVKIYVAGDVALVPMPNLVKLTQDAAVTELTRLGIQHRIQNTENDGTHRAGEVAYTEPNAGNDVATGSTIVNVYVYDVFRMPDLNSYVGQNPVELYKFLSDRSIGYTVKESVNNDPAKNGTVERIDYVVNGEVTSSTVVTVYVYGEAAPATVTVPQVTDVNNPPEGWSVTTTEEVSDQNPGIILRQDPAANTTIDANASKTITVVVAKAADPPPAEGGEGEGDQ